MEIWIRAPQGLLNLLVNLLGMRIGSISALLAFRNLPDTLLDDLGRSDSNVLAIISVKLIKS